ncbi:MAG TPA: NO-inducible flavohemoprotein [Dyella sp.]|uniref:NO-inducible flavohemoprotein n=1 Tax=Dyella sp. TaxID=1869338 RepID=UPI002F91EF60
MLTLFQRDIVKQCVPALQSHGLTLTKVFYARLFDAQPELKHVFNMRRQATGEQQQALANAVLGYAKHIDNPEVLNPVLDIIVSKHVSMGIRAEQYPIVGKHLLAAIAEVLGDAATPEVIDAWAAAYGQLADLLIAKEQELYTATATAAGGWSGWRPFRLIRRVVESDQIASLYLAPADGGTIPPFKPGQYVSVRSASPDGMMHVRQYSLSDAPHQPHLRLTIKREDPTGVQPAGKVSHKLHNTFDEGQCLDLSAPQGNFTIDDTDDRPIVLLSGGVGLTPMTSILGHVMEKQPHRRIIFLHATRDRRSHAMNDWLRETARISPSIDVQVYYEHVASSDIRGYHYDHHGRMDLPRNELLKEAEDADYFICGPKPFMTAQVDALIGLNIATSRIHTEVFGAALA